MMKRASVESAAEAYLELLAARRVEYFFGNAGADFAPIIEAYPAAKPMVTRCRGPAPSLTRCRRWPWLTGTPW